MALCISPTEKWGGRVNEGPFGLTFYVNSNSGRAAGMEARGIQQPPCPSGHEGPSGHLRDAKWLQPPPLGEMCLIDACSFSALTGADGGITIL